jgi:RNA polymerase sigma-70 factor (ECF subfamily)
LDRAARVIEEDPVEQWVDAWQAGRDREGHSHRLFERFSSALVAFFRKRGFPPESCQDLVQETYVQVFLGLPDFRREVSFKSWLFEIATNVFRKTLRKGAAKKRSGVEIFLDSGFGSQDGEASPAGSPEKSSAWVPPIPPAALRRVLGKERMRTVARGLDEMPSQMRRCALMAWYLGYSNQQIATLLGISPETVKAHHFKARKRLRERLDKLGDFA